MNSHLRPTDSTRSILAAGRATASTRPGKPAPAPTSAIRVAVRSSGTSRPVRLSRTWTRQARSSTIELTEARSSASRARTVSSFVRALASRSAAGSPLTRAAAARRSRSDGARRVHLDDPVVAQRLLCRPVSAPLERLAAPGPVTGGIDDNPLALAQAAEGSLVAEQLQGVDRLPTFAEQQAVVVLTLDGEQDPLVVFLDRHLTLEVELVEHSLDELLRSLGWVIGPLEALGHGREAIRPPAAAQRNMRAAR